MHKILILGSGNFAKYIKDLIDINNEYNFAGYIDSEIKDTVEYTDSNIDKMKKDGIKYIVNGIGNMPSNNKQISILINNLIHNNFIFPHLFHPSSVISPSAKIGKGTIVLENAVIKSNTAVGDFCLLNSLSVVSHDCILGNQNHLSLGSKIGGGVVMGNNNFLGINSSVNQKINIGSNVIVGSGSTVIKDLKSNITVVGSPAI